MEPLRLTEKEQVALQELLPHLNELLSTLGNPSHLFSSTDDPFLLGAIECSKQGKAIRKKFGEYMIIFTFLEQKNEDGEILRVFCSVDKEGHFLRLFHNYISQVQADLIKGV